MASKTVYRTIVISGDEAWVDKTLANSYLQPQCPPPFISGFLVEVLRTENDAEEHIRKLSEPAVKRSSYYPK